MTLYWTTPGKQKGCEADFDEALGQVAAIFRGVKLTGKTEDAKNEETS